MEPGNLSSAIITAKSAGSANTDLILVAGLLILAFLFLISVVISAAEIAFFSIRPEELEKIRSKRTRKADLLLKLNDRTERVAGALLVAGNIINVAIIIVTAFLFIRIFYPMASPPPGIIIMAIAATVTLLFLIELVPKIYASRHQTATALALAGPVSIIEKVFRPATLPLILSATFVRKRLAAFKSNTGINGITNVFELSATDNTEDVKILRGIAKFGNIEVSQIMCPRIDVTAIDITLGFNKVKSVITDSGFSRIPVYSGSFDSVKGVLYAKDILPFAGNPDSYKWQALMRPPHFVPETKKINELLKEFQINRNHMAIVIDEYGGNSGIVTLEDVLEEIVGEITDESDEEEILSRKVGDNAFIFVGKIPLNDFFEILDIEADQFEDVRGESETLAGLILELTGEIPQKGKIIKFGKFRFRIEAADKRRIKEIRVEIEEGNEVNEAE